MIRRPNAVEAVEITTDFNFGEGQRHRQREINFLERKAANLGFQIMEAAF